MPTYTFPLYENQFNNFYEQKKILLRQNIAFQTISTSSTKIIKSPEYTIIFNEDGKNDYKLFPLFRKIKQDAEIFTLNNFENKFKSGNNIDWFKFIQDLNSEIIKTIKMDINSAYWNIGRQIGLISEETNQLLEKTFPPLENRKEYKKARLKILGSLATKRNITNYENGKPIQNNTETSPYRDLYFLVCGLLDEKMKVFANLMNNKNDSVFYYYWDCVFFKDSYKSLEDAKSIMKDFNFEFTIEACNTTINHFANTITTQKDKEEPTEYPLKKITHEELLRLFAVNKKRKNL